MLGITFPLMLLLSKDRNKSSFEGSVFFQVLNNSFFVFFNMANAKGFSIFLCKSFCQNYTYREIGGKD